MKSRATSPLRRTPRATTWPTSSKSWKRPVVETPSSSRWSVGSCVWIDGHRLVFHRDEASRPSQEAAHALCLTCIPLSEPLRLFTNLLSVRGRKHESRHVSSLTLAFKG